MFHILILIIKKIEPRNDYLHVFVPELCRGWSILVASAAHVGTGIEMSTEDEVFPGVDDGETVAGACEILASACQTSYVHIIQQKDYDEQDIF